MATVDVEVHTTIDRPRATVASYCCDPDNVKYSITSKEVSA